MRRWSGRSSRRWPKARPRTGFGELPDEDALPHPRARRRRRTTSALFFGEDIFIAIGSILLIRGFLEQNGIHVEPHAARGLGDPDRDRARSSIHGTRLLLLDRSLARERISACAEDDERRMITLEFVYIAHGRCMVAGVAIVNLRDRDEPEALQQRGVLGTVRGHVPRRLAPAALRQRAAS